MRKQGTESITQGVLWLDFYGFVVKIISEESLLNSLTKDFSFFLGKENDPNLSIKVFSRSPDYKSLPIIPSSFITPRNIVFKKGEISYIDYFGKALSVIDQKKKFCKVFTSKYQLAHEICYLTILFYVGRHLDRKRLHRIHALGFSYKRKGIIIILPSGGGKTSIALGILKESDFKLLSDESPLVDKRGNVYPFPLRIGVTEKEIIEKIPEKYIEKIERMEFGPKNIIDIEYFSDSLGEVSPLGLLFLGVRTLGDVCRIEKAARVETYYELFKNMVFGMGLYQGMEFLFSRKTSEIIKLIPLMFSRMRNAIKLGRKSRTYKIFLGYNREKNILNLLDFIRKKII